MTASWEPSQHAVVFAGVAVAAILLVSVAVVRRDAWVPVAKRHRRALLRAGVGAIIAVGVAFAIAHRGQLEDMLDRVEQGDPVWLAVAVGLEVISFSGYVLLTRRVYSPRAPRMTWGTSVDFTLAGVVATRLLSAGGAGGIAFTAWALNRAGMPPRLAARHLAAFLLLLYSVYVGALVLGGLVVVLGVLPGGVPMALGWVALGVGLAMTLAFLAILRIPGDVERRANEIAERGGRLSGLAARLATVPQIAGKAARLAVQIVRANPSVMIGPLVWWAFDIATLWASFNAFGDAPATGTIVLCYFLGSLGNLLPLPGGVGGTEGGMVGAFAASGVDAGFALLAVIGYQLISTYLPALPGIGAYVSLRRRMRGWTAAADEPEDAVAV